jgi:hypothetical protein
MLQGGVGLLPVALERIVALASPVHAPFGGMNGPVSSRGESCVRVARSNNRQLEEKVMDSRKNCGSAFL